MITSIIPECKQEMLSILSERLLSLRTELEKLLLK